MNIQIFKDPKSVREKIIETSTRGDVILSYDSLSIYGYGIRAAARFKGKSDCIFHHVKGYLGNCQVLNPVPKILRCDDVVDLDLNWHSIAYGLHLNRLPKFVRPEDALDSPVKVQDQIVHFWQTATGKPYGMWDIAMQAADTLFKTEWFTSHLNQDKAWYCSEVIAAGYDLAIHPGFIGNIGYRSVTPYMWWEDAHNTDKWSITWMMINGVLVIPIEQDPMLFDVKGMQKIVKSFGGSR